MMTLGQAAIMLRKCGVTGLPMRACIIVGIIIFTDAQSSARCSTGMVSFTANQHDFNCVDGTAPLTIIDTGDFDGAAVASYSDDVNRTGWGTLRVRTHSNATSWQQAFAAGVLEGRLTHLRIHQYYTNYMHNTYAGTGAPCLALRSFMTKQRNWLRSRALALDDVTSQGTGTGAGAGDARYWPTMSLLLAQVEGLARGYYDATVGTDHALGDHDATFDAMYLLNSVGDLETLNGLLCPNDVASPMHGAEELPMLDCSALVRLVPQSLTDGAMGFDVLSSHSTWRGYYAMLRTWKVYNFAFAGGPGRALAIASSPGLLHSKDDFYARADGLVAMETTNGVFDESLLHKYAGANNSDCALTWQRAQVSNWVADSGDEWTSVFAKYNSGTYNNQWMVVDGGRVRKANSAGGSHDGWLWILEQIPGMTQRADVTAVLRRNGFWPSYNIPYFPRVYNRSGYAARAAASTSAEAEQLGYHTCARARIFARDAPNVKNMSGMRSLMTYNDYQHDPLAHGSPSGAIMARGDLPSLPTAPLVHRLSAGGGIDAKIVTASAPTVVSAISGPTHAQQAPFQWVTAPWTNGTSRLGVPEQFNFDWVEFQTKHDNNEIP